MHWWYTRRETNGVRVRGGEEKVVMRGNWDDSARMVMNEGGEEVLMTWK